MHGLARGHRRGHAGGAGRLDAHDARCRVAGSNPRGHARQQTTAAHRQDEHVGGESELADDLHAHRALAGDGEGVVEGGHEDAARGLASSTAARLASS